MLFRGYGWEPYTVAGDDPDTMHQRMATTMDRCVEEIPRNSGGGAQGRRGEGGAREVADDHPAQSQGMDRARSMWDGHKVEGFWRAHQIPILKVRENPEHRKQLEEWLRSYGPEELFDEGGRLIEELAALAPKGTRRVSANPHANGGLLRKPLAMPAFRDYAVEVKHPGQDMVSPTDVLGRIFA